MTNVGGTIETATFGNNMVLFVSFNLRTTYFYNRTKSN